MDKKKTEYAWECIADQILGMGLPPFKRCPSVPDHFVLYGEFPEYGADGRPTGWMRAAWSDPKDDEVATSGRMNVTHLTRKLTPEELSEIPWRASDGSVLAASTRS